MRVLPQCLPGADALAGSSTRQRLVGKSVLPPFRDGAARGAWSFIRLLFVRRNCGICEQSAYCAREPLPRVAGRRIMGASVHTRGELSPASDLMPPTRREVLGLAAIALVVNAPATAIAGNSSGQLTWGLHISLTPTSFDPAETSGNITPFLINVRVARRAGEAHAGPAAGAVPRLESWSASEDQLAYDFVLRKGIEFHNGDPVTADDVKFSFSTLSWRRPRSDTGPRRHSGDARDSGMCASNSGQPWPDFLTVCCAVTGAGWVVPKAYVESSAKRDSRRHRSVLVHISLSHSRLVRASSSKHSTATGARHRRSSTWRSR